MRFKNIATSTTCAAFLAASMITYAPVAHAGDVGVGDITKGIKFFKKKKKKKCLNDAPLGKGKVAELSKECAKAKKEGEGLSDAVTEEGK
ncbi:hypothetical protein GCM10007939_17530 [Amylibacter marinus]|uniref:PsiF repeat-containing protein n=1 Tax=Amylibacter marinus TaxID=1475483 RepID=A0ABQ5VW24_9RHOB|nr:hypothetical protein [Amylibacter marinus]GLQ35470.1 hypothetical protein GCM10007939_17530 [Amylibacter marinus]